MHPIKLSLPHLGGKEAEYVAKAVESTWIVPLGPYVDEFENRLETYMGCENIVALSSGTAAIHLALILSGVKTGDTVICQNMTFAASANPIKYVGAEPVFIDSEPQTWNIDPSLLEPAITDLTKQGRKPKAIIAVDLYGMPAKLDAICQIADKYGIPVIEDAAEAIGSELDGHKCGTFGRFGILSFNGNKMITTSGGGALICPDKESAKRALFLATQARENKPYYYHETLGYNYRLSNVSAAIGCAQTEILPDRVARRREIHTLYKQLLEDCPGVTVHDNPDARFDSNFWLTTILLKPETKLNPLQLQAAFAERQIETRPLWRPMHMQPLYADATYYGNGVSDDLFSRGLCLPSGSILTDAQITHVAATLRTLLP